MSPIKLGTKIEPWGEISAVGMLNGERYYWFKIPKSQKMTAFISMLPADLVEKYAEDSTKNS